MATWEYCQLVHDIDRQGTESFQVTYFSPDLSQDVGNDVIRDDFVDWEDALSYLGDEGWEAFQIDADGTWFFKRADDWADDWDEDEEE